MRTWIVAGAALLALSLSLNAVAMIRRPAPEAPSRTSTKRPTPAPAEDPGRTHPISEAPRAAAAVAEVPTHPDSTGRFWARLDGLRAVKPQIGVEAFEDAVLRATAEDLGLGAAFVDSARTLLAELRRATREYEDELQRIIAAREAVPAELVERMDDRRHQVRQGLASHLTSDPIHRMLRDRLHEWMAYVLND